MKTILHFTPVLLLLLFSCGTGKNAAKEKGRAPKMESRNKTPDPKGSTDGSVIVSGPVVWNQRVIKGEIQEEGDFYLERSVQNYFIKFCESTVTKEQFEIYLSDQRSKFPILHAEVEFREGDWDSCDEEGKVASRTGKYIVILKFVE